MTLGDIERWLKADDARSFRASFERGKFTVTMNGHSFASKTLVGAIDGCFEELRRYASGMDSMKAKVFLTSAMPVATSVVMPVLTPSLTWTPFPSCVVCGKFPRVAYTWVIKSHLVSGELQLNCSGRSSQLAGHSWNLVNGCFQVILFEDGKKEFVDASGHWNTAP